MLLSRKKDYAKYSRAGDEARDARKWELAAEQYGKAIEQDGSLPWLWVQYGHALKESGRRADAERAYRKAVDLEPKNADTHLQLGHALKLQGQSAEAARAYLQSFILESSVDARQELLSLGWSEVDIQQGVQYINATQGRKPAIRVGSNAAEVMNDAPLSNFDIELPVGYVEASPDIQELIKLGLVQSATQHYRLYGRSEGRDIVKSLTETPPKNAFVLCPSYGKRCGIGEHARYIVNSLISGGFNVTPVRSTRELKALDASVKKDGVLIVNHGPGLFDGYNPELSEGEATSSLLSGLLDEFKAHNLRPIIYLHSLLDRDNEVMYGRQQFIMDFPIPVLTTISSASAHFRLPHVEHGVQPVAHSYPAPAKGVTGRDYPTIGFFGFFQWGGKDFDALLNVAKRLKAKLAGSVATSSKYDEDKLRDLLTEANIQCDLGTGWVTDDELARRLSVADFYYLPQKDYDHWNNSGTARFVANFGKPVLLPAHHPFLDLRDVVIFAEEHDLPAIVSYLREEESYKAASERIKKYAAQHSMRDTVISIAKDLPTIYRNSGLNGFWSVGELSLQALATSPTDAARARLQKVGVSGPTTVEGLKKLKSTNSEILPLSFRPVEEIEVWRKHYFLADLYQVNVQDFIVGLYRRLVKREPTFFEYRQAREMLPVVWGEGGEEYARKILRFIAWVWNKDLSLPEPEAVEILLDGIPVSPAALYLPSDEFLKNFVSQVLIPCDNLARLSESEPEGAFSVGQTRNLFALLSLPKEVVADALRQACAAAGHEISFKGIEAHSVARDRYAFIVQRLADYGINVADVFVLDEPIVERIDYSRSTYALSELTLFDGDAFVVDMTRKLMKRNPQTVEFFHYGALLDSQSKAEVIRQFSDSNILEAKVVDLDVDGHPNYPSISDQYYRRLINDFRSPVAGGWDLRNKYLEDKRNFSRVWLRTKQNRDIWWTQSGGNSDVLKI